MDRNDWIKFQMYIDNLIQAENVKDADDLKRFAEELHEQMELAIEDYGNNTVGYIPNKMQELICCDKCKFGVHSGNGDRYICIVSPEERSEHEGDFYCKYSRRK